MNKKKCILFILFAFFICLAIISFYPKQYNAIPFELPDNFTIEQGNLIALGTPTHGNAEPFIAAAQILKFIHENEGDVAIIFEEDVGAGALMNMYYSMEIPSGYLNSIEKIGVYEIYHSDAMTELLAKAKEMQVRIYGIDIQTTKYTKDMLLEYLQKTEYPNLKQLKVALSQLDTHNASSVLADVYSYLEMLKGDGQQIESEIELMYYITDSIKTSILHNENPNQSYFRDQAMAENVEWIYNYEKEYFDNEFLLIFASNGHVIKEPFNFGQVGSFTPMGYHLDERFKEQYYVIVEDSKSNFFYARNNFRKKVFHIDQSDIMHNKDEFSANSIYCLSSENLPGITTPTWDLTIIGYQFSDFLVNLPEYYSYPVETDSFDSMLYFNQMTPNVLR